MPFNIAEFSSQISGGLARNNLFVATITPPDLLREEFPNLPQNLVFLCKTVELPALDLQTVELQRQTIGPITKRPIAMPYPVVPAIFMVDSGFMVKKFFHRWLQLIYNYDDSKMGQDGQKLLYELGYKEDYAGSIQIDVYSSAGAGDIYTYKLGKANPISIGGVTTSWENAAEIMTLSVSFTYETMKVDGTKAPVMVQDMSRANGILTYISALQSYGQVIDQLHKPTDIQDLINQLTYINLLI